MHSSASTHDFVQTTYMPKPGDASNQSKRVSYQTEQKLTYSTNFQIAPTGTKSRGAMDKLNGHRPGAVIAPTHSPRQAVAV